MIAPALLYAVVVSVLTATVLAFARGSLDPAVAWTSLAAGVGFGAWSVWRPTRRPATQPGTPPGPWEWGAIAIYTLASARAFLWLVFTDGDKIQVLSPNNLGDLSLHLTYIGQLASGTHFWPENPIFTGGQLTYPLGVDLLNALLTLTGVNVHRGLIAVGLAGAALTGLALWRWGRGIALLAFIGNGGLAALVIVKTGALTDFQATLAWKNLFLALFVTQRGILFALPAGLLLLASWRTRFFGGAERESDRLPAWGEVLLYASLPIFHLHSFIFLSLLLGSCFVLVPTLRPPLLRLIGTAFLPATALVLLVTGGLHSSSVLGWKPGWMYDDSSWLTWCADFVPGDPAITAPLLFWPVNFGFSLPLIAWLGWHLWQSRTTDPLASHALWPRALFFPSLFIFLLCVFVKFAPWEWDNTKIMFWSWLTILPLAWQHLLAPRPFWLRALAIVALFGSGLASLVGGLDGTHTGYDLASRRTLDGVTKAVAPLSVNERFIGYPTYNHPLLLAGRKMALGYPGHAWSHGLDYLAVATRIDTLMNGEPDWQAAAAALHVRYLYWGAEEREHYTNSPQPWKDHATRIASGEWGEIYDLSPALR